MRKLTLFFSLLVFIVLGLVPTRAQEASIYSIELQGTINPGSADFFSTSLKKAQSMNAEALLVRLDTPGGLLSSTRSMVQAIGESAIPVIIFVSPSGASATSAGAILAQAAHFVAMAPGSNMGAAHPVGGGGEDIKGEMGKKAANDTAALMRAQAELRGRNSKVAEEIVRSSKSFSAEEALKAGAIEAIAKDQEELLRLLAGKKVRLPQGEKTLAKAFLLSPLQMSAKQKFLHTIADPNISALLLTIGGLALYAEISAGFSLIIPGIVAILSFLLAFISLQTLPIQLGGTLLFFAGILFLIAEIFITSFGVLALAGVASIFLGGLFLIDPGAGTMRVSISLLLSLCAGIGAILGITAYLFTQERKKKVLPELLIETEGRVIALPTKENDDLALVQVGGEIWKFQCSDNLSLEDQVLIESREGMVLKGKKVQHKE